jgi:hypothetical protein
MKKARFVLLVTDTNACLALPDGTLIEAQEDWQEIAAALAADPHRPVRLVLDSAEQVYEQLTLRLRNPFDRRRLLARKLAMLSPDAPVAGVVKLEKEHYLLTGSGTKSALADALALLARTGNSLYDIALYPIEAGAYLVEQFPALASGWSIVTLDSRLTGFRQLVLRHGKTVFSRLMPPARLAEGWQREIGTMLTYLPRLGLPRETPVALVANLDQAPLADTSFTGATVGELFFLPADDRDVTGDFLHWHAQQSRATLPVGQHDWRLERFSRQALRVACCLAAIITLLGTAGTLHLHHRAQALLATAAAEAAMQSQLATAMASELAENGTTNQLRVALALHGEIAPPGDELVKVKTALAALPPELGLQEIAYQRAPFMLRAAYEHDPLPQLPALAKQLPGLAVTTSGNTVMVTKP